MSKSNVTAHVNFLFEAATSAFGLTIQVSYPVILTAFWSNMECFQLCLFVSWFVAAWTSSAVALSDGESLRAIRDAWKLNHSWWQGDNPCKGWEGVKCDSNNRVTYLNLSNTGIYGPMPDEIRNLNHLTNLDLSNRRNSNPPYNLISGDLSPLGSLTSLLHLNISFNRLQLSMFPAAIYNLSNLITLRIDNNVISGSLPPELGILQNLVYFYLGNNSLTGPIPKEYSKLSKLQELSMWNNNLQSTIPPEFGNLQNLRYLNLHDCSLYGGLPKELGSMKNLQNISLYRNQLTGSIPDSWRNLTNLRNLYLLNNFLTKSIPPWLLTLPNLYNLSIDYNLFDGGLNLENVNISFISVTCNFLSGAAPTPSNKISLNWTGNCFTGSDPGSKIKCSQSYYNCDSFFQSVPNGSCPSCPFQQVLYDPATCICMLNVSAGEAVSHKRTKELIGSIIGVVAFIGCMFVFWWRWSGMHRRSTKDEWEGPEGVQRFVYGDLSKATNGFSSSHEIGIGGFGKVFCGAVDGKFVAIKRAHASSIRSSSGFRNEVILLSRLHHRNLVRLLGFCEEVENQILVYEYMPNGNLHTLLFKNQSTVQLDWLKRLDIALGVAQGLEYLHSFADPPVIHRDVKPSNVLLDENLVAKLSDFGISREAPEFQTQFSTKPAGTVGYIDPQYILREQITTASDVYSFGMVMLELVSGQKSIDNTRLDEHNLVEWAKIKLRAEGIRCIVDPRLGNDYPERVYHDIVRLAIDCASFDSADRPSMKVVVSILDACRWSVAPRLLKEMDDVNESVMSKEDDSQFTPGEVLVKDDSNSFADGSCRSFSECSSEGLL